MNFLIASLPFAWFMAVSSITPGPNNLMLAASGMNYGVRRTMPHMFGVIFGFALLLSVCALGIGAVYQAYPQIRVVLMVFGVAYLTYLSYKIAMSGKLKLEARETSTPITFVQATLFQFVNPKGLVTGIAAMATLMPEGATLAQQLLLIAAVSLAINLPTVWIWAYFGHMISTVFKTERSHRIINIILALALLCTIPLIIVH